MPSFLLLDSTLYAMISIITVLLARVLLHWTFIPLFRSLIFRITRVESTSGLSKDITYYLPKVLTDHWIKVRNLPALGGCSQQVKTGGDQYGNPLDLISWGGRSFYVLLQFQVEVQRKAYMCVILKLSTVLFLAKRGLSYYPS